MPDKKVGLFDWINSLSHHKGLSLDNYNKDSYDQFMITRAFSNYKDTVLYANDLNVHPCVSDQAHFLYYQHIIRKNKRWSKWPKPKENKQLDLVMEYYPHLSKEKCLDMMKWMTKSDYKEMKEHLEEGGKQNVR